MDSSSMYKCRHRFGRTLRHAMYSYLTEYETSKLVLIQSLRFAILLRLMQIIILIYSVVYLLIYEKGYQKQDTSIIASVGLKVKGIGYIHVPNSKTIVTDVADYVVPPSENNAIFIRTNYIQTDQRRMKCPENPSLKEAVCEKDADCQNRPFSPKINGLWTGQCLLSPQNLTSNETMNTTKNSQGLCEYAGWCPPEDDQSPPMLIKEVLNFTLFIKAFIEFSTFGVKHKNMVEELKHCVFHPQHDQDCPIFRIDYIINQAEKDPKERDLMLLYGGVIRVKIEWNCNLDRNIKICKPEYSFARLDVPYRDRPFSVGFNFRYAYKWKHNGDSFRTLTKAYGLRLIISVSGKAGKFDFITLTLNVGSLVGIFGLATFVCDIILLHISKKARLYRNHVFEVVQARTSMNNTPQNSKKNLSQNSGGLSNPALNEILVEARKSPGKTVAIRPLTLMNVNKQSNSAFI